MIDKHNRKIDYARISITDLCNLRCKYCMNKDGVILKSHNDIMNIEQIENLVSALASKGVTKIRFTGGEPLVRKGLMSLLENISHQGQIKNIGLTTNGILLGDMAYDLKKNGVSLLNISLDSLDPDKYKFITRGGNLQSALSGIEKAIEVGFEKIKINAVLLRDFNENELDDFIALGKKYDVEIRFIELMPFENQYEFCKDKFISYIEVASAKNLISIGMQGSTNVEYFLTEDGQKIGFIGALSNKFCNLCNRIRITADGKLLNCLHESIEYDLKPYLDDSSMLAEFIESCILKKPLAHHIKVGSLQLRDMNNIGG